MRTRALLLSCVLAGTASCQASQPARQDAFTAGTPGPTRSQLLDWSTQGDPARGQTEFEVCEGCHRNGGAGRANGSYPRLAGQHATVLVKQIHDIREGRRRNHKMLPFATDDVVETQQVADIAAFLQAQPVSADNGKGPGAALRMGEALYVRDCARCHGRSGEGSGPDFVPRLSGQHYPYLLREVRAIRDGQRGNSNAEMVESIRAYSDADLESVTDYASRLPIR